MVEAGGFVFWFCFVFFCSLLLWGTGEGVFQVVDRLVDCPKIVSSYREAKRDEHWPISVCVPQKKERVAEMKKKKKKGSLDFA